MAHSEGAVETEPRREGLRPREWSEWVERWRGSGLSQREFCRRHGLSLATFNRRVKALLIGSGPSCAGPASSVAAGGWLEVRLSPPSLPRGVESEESLGTLFEVVLGGGRRVRLGPQFDAEGLRRLLTVLESLPC